MQTNPKDNTANWISAFREGQEQALSHFFKQHGQSLIYFAGKLIADEVEAEDIVANVFYKAWERKTTFESDAHLKSSLYISCRNACLNYLRNLKRKTAVQEDYFKQLEKGEEYILYEVIETDYLEILHAEIEQLPDKMKAVFRMIYFDGKKVWKFPLHWVFPLKLYGTRKLRPLNC